MESAKLEKITVPAQSVEASAEDTVDRLKKHPCGSQLAWMLFRSMDEEKFLSFFDSLMPLNEGPIDHLLNETQCMGFLLKRFIDNDLSGRRLRHYNIFKETYEREPNLSGIAWILKEAKVQEIKERAAKRKVWIVITQRTHKIISSGRHSKNH